MFSWPMLTVGAMLFIAYANGANDNFKGVATLFGSRTTHYRKALWWATATTLAGGLSGGWFSRHQTYCDLSRKGLAAAFLNGVATVPCRGDPGRCADSFFSHANRHFHLDNPQLDRRPLRQRLCSSGASARVRYPADEVFSATYRQPAAGGYARQYRLSVAAPGNRRTRSIKGKLRVYWQ
jgi:hypothetical protein